MKDILILASIGLTAYILIVFVMYIFRGLKIKNLKKNAQFQELMIVRYKENSRTSFKSQGANIYWNAILHIDQSSIVIIPKNHFFISLFSRLPYIRLTCKERNLAYTFCPNNISFVDSKNQINIQFDSTNREYDVSIKIQKENYMKIKQLINEKLRYGV